MERSPLQSVLVPVAIVVGAIALLGVAVGGLGGLVVVATLVTVVASIGSRINVTRDDDLVVEIPPRFEAEAIPSAIELTPTADVLPRRPRVATGRAASWLSGRGVAAVRTPEQVIALAVTVGIAALLLVFYLRDLTVNPVAIFCDEAEIGLEAWRTLHRQAELTRIPLFYLHFQYEMPSLPVLWAVPFVALFGRDDFAVRLAAVVPILLALAVVFRTLRRLNTPFAVIAITVFALSPVMIHLSRANFGHGPSLLLVALAFDRYVVARQTGQGRAALVAGLMLGASAYGNSSMFVVVPLIAGALTLSEIVCNGRRWSEYATIARMVAGTVVATAPIMYRAATDDLFLERFHDKNVSDVPLLSFARIGEVLDNYPKYFSFDYLFRAGEAGVPGGFLTRHSVLGAGELNLAFLPLLALAFGTLVLRWRQPEMRFFLPWMIVAVLYPAPDVVTTTTLNAPYTVALFGTFFCLPYVTGYAMFGLRDICDAAVRSLRGKNADVSAEEPSPAKTEGARSFVFGQGRLSRVVASGLLLWVVVSGWQFYMVPYQNYPNVSADYWGWQYGAEPMIQYFLDHEDEFDEFIMDGNFNSAYVFLDFYIQDPDVRAKASIGDLSRLDLSKRQLFGMKKETWDNIKGSQVPPKSYMVIDTILPYPNGTDAIYLLELR